MGSSDERERLAPRPRAAGSTREIRVVIALGSNLGCRGRHLAEARERLAHDGIVAIERRSSVYTSAPIGPEQPDYLNQVVIGRTRLSATDLLAATQAIEAALGRDRSEVRWGPRTIDLDLILYGEEQIESPDLVVPHPECTRRSFVLVPWAEIDPEGVVPGAGAGRTVAEVLAELERSGETVAVERWEKPNS